MKKNRRLRRLVGGDTTWIWSVRQKVDRSEYENCRVTLSLCPEGTLARLAIVFRPGPDRVISSYYFESGTVTTLPARDSLNLYEPGTVHLLLKAAAARGELPTAPGTKEVDGWHLFDIAVAAQHADFSSN